MVNACSCSLHRATLLWLQDSKHMKTLRTGVTVHKGALSSWGADASTACITLLLQQRGIVP